MMAWLPQTTNLTFTNFCKRAECHLQAKFGCPKKEKNIVLFYCVIHYRTQYIALLEMFLFSSHLSMLLVYQDAKYVEMLQKLHDKMWKGHLNSSVYINF